MFYIDISIVSDIMTILASLIYNWAVLWEKGTYPIGEQWRRGRSCVSAWSFQSLCCLHTQYTEQVEASGKKPCLWPYWAAAHVCLKNLGPHDANFSFLMRQLILVNDNTVLQSNFDLQCSTWNGNSGWNEPGQEKTFWRFVTSWNSNQPAQLQRLARCLKFRI